MASIDLPTFGTDGGRPFNGTNDCWECAWCGRLLGWCGIRKTRGHSEERLCPGNHTNHARNGKYGDGCFCSKTCGYRFAVTLSQSGVSLHKTLDPAHPSMIVTESTLRKGDD